MAKFRKVFTAFWDDLFIEKLSPEDRYFYLFLLTNPLCTECGIYEISISKMCSYTGYNRESVKSIIQRFKDSRKIFYNDDTCEVAIVNKMRYLDRLGKPILDCMTAELRKIKDYELIGVVAENSVNEQVTKLFEAIYKEKHDTLAKRNTIRPHKSTVSSELCGQEEEKEEEKEEEEDMTIRSQNFLQNSNLNRQPNIPTKEKVYEVISNAGGTKEMAKSFFEKYEGTGWFLNNSPITNFVPLANKFVDNWKRTDKKKEPIPATEAKINLK